MEGIERSMPEHGGESERGSGAARDDFTAAADDPATSAASVIADQALSIFQAVDARTAEIDARARRDADEIRQKSTAVSDPARERLDGMLRELDALSTALERVAQSRSGGAHDG
jgi:hypothetical protein